MPSLQERLAAYRATIEGDYVASVEANRFLQMMRAEHPEELDEWLEANAATFIARSLSRMERRAREVTRAHAFAAAVDSGDEQRLSLFRQTFVIDDSNTRRPMGDMRGADCSFVADAYERSGLTDLAIASFWRALAAKAGDKPVSSVISEADCERLLGSFMGPRQDPRQAQLAA